MGHPLHQGKGDGEKNTGLNCSCSLAIELWCKAIHEDLEENSLENVQKLCHGRKYYSPIKKTGVNVRKFEMAFS